MPSVSEPLSREKELNSLSILTVFIALVAVTMTFGSLIAVFFLRSQNQESWGHIHIPLTLWITTGVLMASSVTLEIGRHKLADRDQPGFFRVMLWTTALGTLFLVGQIVAWFQILHGGIKLKGNPHSWFIFLFTGLHALHIVAGLAALSYLVFRTRRPASGPKYQMSTRAIANGTALFWHYLDVMWVLLFALLLFWKP